MSKKSVNLTASPPRCRFCLRYWQPEEGVIADKSYCRACSESRRAVAAKAFAHRPLELDDVTGAHVLPRLLRSA